MSPHQKRLLVDQKIREKADNWANGHELDPNGKYFTTGEVAKILRYSRKRVIKLIDDGKLRAKVPVNHRRSRRLVSLSSLKEYIRSHENVAALCWLLNYKKEALLELISKAWDDSLISDGEVSSLECLMSNLGYLDGHRRSAWIEALLPFVRKVADMLDQHMKIARLMESRKQKKDKKAQ